MSFVDELEFKAKAGNGGDGVVRFRHEKGREFMGPSGGDGGNGGNVYIRAVRDSNILGRHRYIKEYNALNGENGRSSSEHGANGEDLYISLPVGSLVTNKNTGEVFEILSEGEEIIILKGGIGGFGNEHFKSSRNQAPKEFKKGTRGESGDFYVELRLVADIGLVGLPNAGKSSLLNILTNADSKVGDFQFTTLDPHLGVHYGIVIADIPGIIEGASSGKGLGHKFLRHIRRTKVIFHCISSEYEDPLKEYQIIRNELEEYDKDLAQKPEIILITKTDLIDEEKINKFKGMFKNKEVLIVSIIDEESIKKLSRYITQYFN